MDPRRTKEAEMADLWLQVRPGTDVALMLGWINRESMQLNLLGAGRLSGPLPAICFALTRRNFIARKSAVGRIQHCCVVSKKSNV